MMAKEINKMMIDKDLKKGELAERCGWTASNLYNKMQRDDFKESDLATIAEALGMELRIEFVPKEVK